MKVEQIRTAKPKVAPGKKRGARRELHTITYYHINGPHKVVKVAYPPKVWPNEIGRP